MPPNIAQQRTPSAAPPAPLSFGTLGAGRHLLVFLVGVLLLAAAAAAEDSSGKLLGRWRSLETSRGGIGSMLAFRKKGVVEYSIGAVVEMPYRIEGSQLVVPPGRTDGPEERQTMTWLTSDKLRLGTAGSVGTELTRTGPADASDRLIGEWRGFQEMNGRKIEVLYFFYPKGKLLLLMPFQGGQGTYSTQNGRIQLSWPNCPMPDAGFTVDNDVLTFTPSNSRQARYARY